MTQLYKIRQWRRQEYINIVQSILRMAMLSNLLKIKMPLGLDQLIDHTVVVIFGISTNFIGIGKQISLISNEQLKI